MGEKGYGKDKSEHIEQLQVLGASESTRNVRMMGYSKECDCLDGWMDRV